ncbi:MAG: phosphoribosylformylglycinamidine cyclo-ligase [Gammaproteobacteria bacterium]|nr:phosphoribosylformylglycinamidine cyclo-ligase [Gammaproteobacteria bacterium]|tara:strand:- start:2712 stop:3737 length:1026 start_codon:yes stop_codon:yes gene_type:complete
MKKSFNKLTYKKSGVDIKKANELIKTLKNNTDKSSPNIISTIGGFCSLYKLNRLKEPVIVSGTDGVGTKLKLATILKQHKYIGQDLLAMCVNDVITSGATPLFFLDYFATGKLNTTIHSVVLKSIKNACNKYKVPLIGGETAEMPGLYNGTDYDLAGFCVGIVEKKNIIDGRKIRNKNIIIGIHSSGIHANGFSLINELVKQKKIQLNKKIDKKSIGEMLITPTLIYSDVINKILPLLKGIANITGGGLTENIPRIMPKELSAEINLKNWKLPKIFSLLQEKANLKMNEMLETFNCGIGMIIIIDQSNLKKVCGILKKNKYAHNIIGKIIRRKNNKGIIYE